MTRRARLIVSFLKVFWNDYSTTDPLFTSLCTIFSGIMYLLVVLRCGDFLYLNYSLILWEEDTLHGFWRRK